MKDQIDERTGKGLRPGYTTGSCAAAAAKAAVWMLIHEKDLGQVKLVTPNGTPLILEVEEAAREKKKVRCAIRKDSGDDPDITDGILVFAEAALTAEPGVRIAGGEGIGRVTRPGLDQPVGETAINSVPRRMIREAVEEVAGKEAAFHITISIPGGRELAEKTFNPKLGIEGGLSILGTSGIVEPMSDNAVLQTIRSQIRMHRAEGDEFLYVVPGNYGKDFLKRTYGFDPDNAVACSNFAADTMRMAAEEGFARVFFAGHAGKLIKIAGGIENTHSRYGDHRMEITLRLIREKYGEAAARSMREPVASCVAMDEAVRILKERDMDRKVFDLAAERIREHILQWSDGRLKAQVAVFSNVYGILGEAGR